MGSGRYPQPKPRSWASSLADIDGRVNTSCPGRMPTVIGARPRAVSATATMRWLAISVALSGSGARASGWCGATAKMKLTSPIISWRMSGPATRSAGTPMARSAWPVLRASQVPVITSLRMRSRVGGLSA